MTTQQAFLNMLAQKELTDKLNLKQNDVRAYLSKAKKSKISSKTMEKMLLEVGYTKIPEVWSFVQ